ncbi:MAG: hypothetical protein HY459_02315 [Parcubacteria group bacterium]|nr:hypothetical protein [Parcubacteria group bacterium]
MTVWYGVPEAPATIGDITNGGSVIVRGHFRISPAQSGGDFLAYAIRKHESAKEAVARLFSEKYGTAADEVRVSIWQEIPNYVFGDVDIPNELYTHTFLASYTEDEWTIVHDINGGISCKTRWELGFPEQIAANCVE